MPKHCLVPSSKVIYSTSSYDSEESLKSKWVMSAKCPSSWFLNQKIDHCIDSYGETLTYEAPTSLRVFRVRIRRMLLPFRCSFHMADTRWEPQDQVCFDATVTWMTWSDVIANDDRDCQGNRKSAYWIRQVGRLSHMEMDVKLSSDSERHSRRRPNIGDWFRRK